MQAANPGFPIVSSGYSWLRQFAPNFAAAMLAGGRTTFAGFGRTAFAMPHFAKALIERGRWEPTETCIACSSCTQIMRDGGKAGCVIRDGEVYGPIYLEGRMKDPGVVRELARECRDCVAPTCVVGCPAKVDIPGFVGAIADGDDRRAYDILRKTNALPEICSRVCPAEVQCEGFCIQRHLSGKAVPIRLLQKYVSEKAREEGWVAVKAPAERSGKRVAVVGAGPAGLSCAVGLLERGHEVTIFDPSGAPAGTAGATIPAQRLAEDTAVNEITALLGSVPADRLHRETGKALGQDYTLAALMADGFDAAFIAVGLSESTGLPGAARPKSGVVDALGFLRSAKRGEFADAPKVVAVLGGGNTAIDAAVTAKRLGALDVYVVYRRSFAEMPAWPAERTEALEAGVHFLILTQPIDYVADDEGRLKALKVARTRLDEADDSGRRRPSVVEGSEWILDTDLVIEAIGQRTSSELSAALGGVRMTKNGLIATEIGSAATSVEGVFAGGDVVNGGTTAARAVHEGYAAAAEIDEYLAAPAGKV
jgi:glutamate synthase (NADPH/NADH) small chain